MPRQETQGIPEEEPQGPSFPRPWYYRPEYMIPMFVFWPAWAVLVLRSPWNNNVLLGGMAWAVFFVGAFMGLKWLQAGIYHPIMTFYVPGVLLTIFTQVQWTRYRHEMAGDGAATGQGSEEHSSPDRPPRPSAANQESEQSRAPERPPRPSARRRRRNPRTGRSKG